MTENEREKLITRQQIIGKYGLSKGAIHRYFPRPAARHIKNGKGRGRTISGWTQAIVSTLFPA